VETPIRKGVVGLETDPTVDVSIANPDFATIIFSLANSGAPYCYNLNDTLW